jgi:outer membrane protein assembly factor BamD (BamD/ComL family)
MKKTLVLQICTAAFLLFASPVAAISYPNFECEEQASHYLSHHFNKACCSYNEGLWHKAVREFKTVVDVFPGTSEASEAYYFLGVSYYQLQEYEFANAAFDQYLRCADNPELFEEAIYYKFWIAEAFKCGAKRRLLGSCWSPKWFSGHCLAITIYDEIIIAVPNHELAAFSLFSKGCLLQKMCSYRESVDAFQMLIRRFPRHELTPMAYLKIGEVYLQQSQTEFQNPDILAMAELNARRFKEEFPRDTTVLVLDSYVERIRERSARGLCDVGRFYERMGYPDGACIYYRTAIKQFPCTRIADYCRHRVEYLGYDYAEGVNDIENLPIPIEEEEECDVSDGCEASEEMDLSSEEDDAPCYFERSF